MASVSLPHTAFGFQAPAAGARLSGSTVGAYLIGASVVAALGSVIPSGPLADLLVAAAGIAVLPWLLVATTETLLVLTVLALPFDTWKTLSVVSATNVLITIAMARLILDVVRGAKQLRPSFAYRPLLAVGIVVVLSTALAIQPATAARLLVSVFGAGALAVLLVNYADSPEMRERLLDALFLAGLFMGGTAILQFVAFRLGVDLWTVYGEYYIFNLGINQLKVTGIFSAPATLATYMLPAIACGAFLWSRRVPAAQRIIMRAATILCLAAAVLTTTRATLLTIALLGATLVVTRVSGRLRNPVKATLVGVTVLFAMSLLLAPRLFAFLNQMNPLSTYARLSIYAGGLASFRAHPVLGSGLGAQVMHNWTNPALYDLAAGAGSKDLDVGAWFPRDTHSTALQIAVDLGIAGLLAFGWLLVATLRRALAAARAEGGRSVTAAILAAFLGTLFVLLFNDGIAMKPLWLMLGLLWVIAPRVPIGPSSA